MILAVVRAAIPRLGASRLSEADPRQDSFPLIFPHSVHFHVARSNTAAEVVELHVRVIRQERHRHGRVSVYPVNQHSSAPNWTVWPRSGCVWFLLAFGSGNQR
jgi:hypothetical protein